MNRRCLALAPALLALLAVAGCGGSGSGSPSSASQPTVPAASAGSSGSSGGSGTTSGGAPAPSGSAAPGGVASPTTDSSPVPASTPGGPKPSVAAAGGRVFLLPPAGQYTYHLSGSSSSAFGSQKIDSDSTLTVDHPSPDTAHSTEKDANGSTEQTMVARADGLYLAEIHLTQPGFDEDFKPTNPALLFPRNAVQGQQWNWSMTSSDGKYTLHAQLTLADAHSSATMTDGTRLSTVAVTSVLHIDSSSIHITTHQRDEAARNAVIVREHTITDGTAYGTKVHGDTTRVLTRQPQ